MIGVYAWLVAALLFLIFEMGHPGLFFWLSFSLGSFVAAFLTWYDYSWSIVGIGFLLSSLVAIALLKRFVGSLVHHGAHTLTNTDALIGKIGIVVTPIMTDKPGRVKIGGEEWLARASHEEHLEEGVRVSVVAVRGSHVVVKKVSE